VVGMFEKLFVEKINNRTYLKAKRKSLRSNLTSAEARLWKLIQNSKLDGIKFRRQHSLGNYIVDFYCPKYLLVIELDGNIHFNPVNEEYDTKRTTYINSLGIKVIRFENKEVFEKTEFVLEEIKQNCINKRF
jgi:very-short-patch-repair endonuclease